LKGLFQGVLQAEIDGVVHHARNWEVNTGWTYCEIAFDWNDAVDEDGSRRFQGWPAKRMRGNATCISCIAEEHRFR
jgi:hypothetical protein